ncbi:TolC family protein [Flavobacterium agrisoli]|uniref:TolC family protein n=1 Tax=Flavobacterium agrisoli TaxID=2793066 RepID=A0A934UKN8_9FLAO|nr:TolC family protein [Flavobacterium agrisoli]MBK0371296.1 TolC family protein [Flavobacterium agrisoli]
MFRKKSIISSCSLLKKVLFCSLFILGIHSLQAQQTQIISLKEAVQLAKENNDHILQAQLEVTLADQNSQENKERRLPEIELSGSYSRITNLTEFKEGFLKGKDVVHTIPEIYHVGTAIKMPIYAGNKINNAITIANQQKNKADVNQEKVESDIQLAVIGNYLGIYKLMALQKIIEDNIAEEKKRLQEVQSLQKHGTVTKNEVLRTELQLSDRKLSALTNSKNIQIELHNLKTLLQIPQEQEISIDTTATILENGIDSYESYAAKSVQNEEIRMANQEIDIKKTELKLVKGNYLPKIQFFGNFNLKYPNYMFFPPDPYLYSLGQVGIEASFDLSGLYKNKIKVQKAKTEIAWEEREAKITKDKVLDQLYKNHTQYEEVVERFAVVDKAVALADENYRIVKLKYLNQLALITEMVDADNALVEAKYEKIATRIDAAMKHYELLHTAGLLHEEN